MTNADIVYARLYNQRLSQPDFATPAEVVRWFGAVQAQDFLAALYAIGLRMPSATELLVEQAIADRTIVRSWPMRRTIHFMAAEDARWMVSLLARRQNIKSAGQYRREGLTPEIFVRAGEVFASVLQGEKLLTRAEMYSALFAAEVPIEGQRGYHLLNCWAQEGLICLGPRREKQHTFALLDEWIPASPMLEGDEALAALARRYFSSHGPATEYDFAWWAGLTLTEVRRGVRLAGQALVQITIDDQTYWSDVASSTIAQRDSRAYLLPPFDEFTVAYTDRRAFLGPTHFKEALNGIGPGVILDGSMVATWKRTLKKGAVSVKIAPFAPLSKTQFAAVEQAAQRYGRFLGLSTVVSQ